MTDIENKRKYNTKEYLKYATGPRSHIINTLLYAAIIPYSCLDLTGYTPTYYAKKLDELQRKGEIKKEKIMCTKSGDKKRFATTKFWVARFDHYTDAFADSLREYFSSELLDYYQNNSKQNVYRLSHDNFSEPIRIERNAEVVMFLSRLPVDYLPGGKKPLWLLDSNEDNVYYSSSELKKNDEDAKGIQASKCNGIMFTRGGTYLFYNFSKWSLDVVHLYEGNMKSYVNTKFADGKSVQEIKGPILTYATDSQFINWMNPQTEKDISSMDNLESHYKETYMVPLDQNGQKLVELMCYKNWQQKLRQILLPPTAQKNKALFVNADAVVDGNRNIFIFCNPNITGLRTFMGISKSDKEEYEIICFDFQEPLVRACAQLISAGRNIKITAVPLSLVHDIFMLNENKARTMNGPTILCNDTTAVGQYLRNEYEKENLVTEFGSYANLYCIPVNDGEKYIRLMSIPRWEQRLYSTLIPRDYLIYDAEAIRNKDGKVSHIHLLCIPNLNKLKSYITGKKSENDIYSIRCFNGEDTAFGIPDIGIRIDKVSIDKVVEHIETSARKEYETQLELERQSQPPKKRGRKKKEEAQNETVS